MLRTISTSRRYALFPRGLYSYRCGDGELVFVDNVGFNFHNESHEFLYDQGNIMSIIINVVIVNVVIIIVILIMITGSKSVQIYCSWCSSRAP